MQAIAGASCSHFVPNAINDNGWIVDTMYGYPVELELLTPEPGSVDGAYNLDGVMLRNTGTVELYVNGRFTIIVPANVYAVPTVGPGKVRTR